MNRKSPDDAPSPLLLWTFPTRVVSEQLRCQCCHLSTTLGVVSYVGIVIAGMSSYECPFQTPSSSALRGLRDSASIVGPPSRAIILTLIGGRHCRDKIFIGFLWLYRAPRDLSPRDIHLTDTASGIRVIGSNIGHQIILGLLRLDRISRDAKPTIVSEVRRYQDRSLLPISVGTPHRQSPTLQADIKFAPKNLNITRASTRMMPVVYAGS